MMAVKNAYYHRESVLEKADPLREAVRGLDRFWNLEFIFSERLAEIAGGG